MINNFILNTTVRTCTLSFDMPFHQIFFHWHIIMHYPPPKKTSLWEGLLASISFSKLDFPHLLKNLQYLFYSVPTFALRGILINMPFFPHPMPTYPPSSFQVEFSGLPLHQPRGIFPLNCSFQAEPSEVRSS